MAIREHDPVPSPLAQGGMRGPIMARHAIRVGDVERDGAAHELGEHYVAGRLTLEELHERLGLVLSARTRGQLITVMADLPTFRRLAPQAMPALAKPTSALSASALSASAPSISALSASALSTSAPSTSALSASALSTSALSGSVLSTSALSASARSASVPSRSPSASASSAGRAPALEADPGHGEQADATDVGRFAAVGLLLLAMLIWLLTVLMFTRHGYYYPSHHYPPPPWQH